jgi:hypothetical protein
MKRSSTISGIISALLLLLVGCGGSGGQANIEGPILSLDQIKSLMVDQFFVNGGLDDEYSERGEFSVYLRDAATGSDVACARAEDGMDKLSVPAVYYGGLNIPLKQVEGDLPESVARFQVVFVEQDSEGCPLPIDDDDDIAGITPEFTFEGLMDQEVWAMNGRGVVVFRAEGGEDVSISRMSPALQDGLVIDKLYFDNGDEGDSAERYYIFVDRVEDGRSAYQCQVADDLMNKIRYGDLVYAGLNFPIDCFDADEHGFADIPVRLSLFIQRESGPALIGETDVIAIGELIGEKVAFTNDKGYVSFRSVMATAFSAPVARLGELTDQVVETLTYELTPSADPTLELLITDGDSGFVIACAGAEQGLTGVDLPGTYDGLSAKFVAADGQMELFGWRDLFVSFVERTDGFKCPSPLSAAPTVLASSALLEIADLGAVELAFENGAGSVTLGLNSGDE